MYNTNNEKSNSNYTDVNSNDVITSSNSNKELTFLELLEEKVLSKTSGVKEFKINEPLDEWLSKDNVQGVKNVLMPNLMLAWANGVKVIIVGNDPLSIANRFSHHYQTRRKVNVKTSPESILSLEGCGEWLRSNKFTTSYLPLIYSSKESLIESLDLYSKSLEEGSIDKIKYLQDLHSIKLVVDSKRLKGNYHAVGIDLYSVDSSDINISLTQLCGIVETSDSMYEYKHSFDMY